MAKTYRPTGNGTEQQVALREYHVIPEGDGWVVERDEAVTGLFAHDLHAAVAQAVACAQRDQHNGLDVMVCVQERGGHCRKVWP